MYSEIRGINVKQVIWKIFLGWKWLLIGAVVCALLLGGLKYVSDSKVQETPQNIESELTIDQIKKLDNIFMLYDRLNYYETYCKESMLLDIDLNQYDLLEIQYYVDSKYSMNLDEEITKDYTPALVSAYGAYVLNSDYVSAVIELIEIEASVDSVRELIQVSTDKDGATFKLAISMPSGCDASKLEAAVDEVLLAKQEEFLAIGQHSIRKINSSVNRVYSDVLEKKIYELKNNMVLVRNAIEAEKAVLSNEQKMYLYENIQYEEYRNEFAGFGATVVVNQPEATINKKIVVVGFLLGAFIVCAIYLMKEVFSNKLQSVDDISNLYKIDNIGFVRELDAAKEKFIIDRLLLSLKNKKYKNYTNKDIVEYVVSKLQIACKIKEINEIAFVTTDVYKLDVLETICDELRKKGIVCTVVKDILQDAQGLKKAKEINNVVIVCEINKSYYPVIDENIISLKQCNMNIMGNIVIE